MDEVNKTLYIPLYGKSQVSKKGIIISDKKAEEIWEKEGFILKGKAKSKWLTYFMSMWARVFDDWAKQQLEKSPEAMVLYMDAEWTAEFCVSEMLQIIGMMWIFLP